MPHENRSHPLAIFVSFIKQGRLVQIDSIFHESPLEHYRLIVERCGVLAVAQAPGSATHARMVKRQGPDEL
jgi:hypothetical protein